MFATEFPFFKPKKLLNKKFKYSLRYRKSVIFLNYLFIIIPQMPHKVLASEM